MFHRILTFILLTLLISSTAASANPWIESVCLWDPVKHPTVYCTKIMSFETENACLASAYDYEEEMRKSDTRFISSLEQAELCNQDGVIRPESKVLFHVKWWNRLPGMNGYAIGRFGDFYGEMR